MPLPPTQTDLPALPPESQRLVRLRRRALATLCLAAGVTTAVSSRPLGASTDVIVPVGHETRCDAGSGDDCVSSGRCDGCGGVRPGSRLGSMLRGSFGHRHYCDGCGSAPQTCNPPIRRFIARPAPIAEAPVRHPVQETYPTILPDDSYSPPADPMPEPLFSEPTPVDRVPTPLPFYEPVPVEASTPVVPAPVAPSVPPAAIETEDDDEPSGLRKDPTAPPVPPESLELPAMPDDAPAALPADAPQKKSEPAQTTPKADAAKPAESMPKTDDKPADRPSGKRTETPLKSAPKTKPKASPAPSRPIPPVDDEDIETGEFEVGQLPASGWITTEELRRRQAERPGLQFRGGEPDVGTDIYGAGKPFGLNR